MSLTDTAISVPLDPLLTKARKVDTIIAVDGSADTDDNWPSGMALRASYERAQMLNGQQILPFFPSAEEFRKEKGYANRPVFCACNATETEIAQGMAMLIYLPNTPSKQGYGTFDWKCDTDEQKGFMASMFETTIRGFPTDKYVYSGECLACGIAERKRQLAKLQRSEKCEKCFDGYC
jgi:lysophospholipase